MRAQGLPINFIVLAALAILILILAAGFVIAGGGSVGGALGPTQVRNTCSGYCNTLQNQVIAYGKGDSAATNAVMNSQWCKNKFIVTGLSGNQSCYQLTSCVATFGDGQTQTIGSAECSTP
jgi:hypothetical protein